MAETNTLEEFREKFRVDELLVYENAAWTWSVRPAQPTVGSGVLSLNRYSLHLSDVTSEEMALLGDAISVIEDGVKRAFNHNIMNYLALMMVDHHVHYHVIPRYDGPRDSLGLEWVDNGWPALPVMSDAQHDDQSSVLAAMQEALIIKP